MWLALVALALCAALAALYLRRSSRRDLPPGPAGLPLVGSALSVGDDPIGTYSQYRRQYGDIFGLYLGNKYLVVLNNIKLAREAFVKQGWNFAARNNDFNIRTIHGKDNSGISNSEGQFNKEHRKFSLVILKEFGMGKNVMEQQISTEARCLVSAISDTEGKAFNPKSLLMAAVANVICQTTFGKRFEYSDQHFLEFMEVVDEAFEALGGAGYMQWMEWTRFLPGVRNKFRTLQRCHEVLLNKFVKPEVAEHRQTFDRDQVRDVIDGYLLEMERSTYKTFTEEDLALMVFEFFLGGTDTTSNTLSWALLYLLHYPHCQARVQAEIDENIGQARDPTTADRKVLTYTDAFLHETMRCGNIAPFGLIHANAEEAHINGYRIPKRSYVVANYHEIFNNPSDWKEPERFNPDRFLQDTTDAFVPFSLGHRVCIGEGLARMELFLFFVFIMQNFTVQVADEKQPLPPMEGPVGLTHGPYPYQVKLVAR